MCNECDDTDPEIFPSDVPEIWYDCADQNCDGNDGDRDGDGYVDAAYTASCTCWATINPSTKKRYYWNDITISDPHAPIFAALGIAPTTAMDIEKRPFYVTVDGKGKPVAELFAKGLS